MTTEYNSLEPKKVFEYFRKLSDIPRGTFNTKAVSDYCVEFAKEHNLKYIQDDANNVVIWKDGTKGYENSEPVIIQGHLDMVCEKTPDSNHDFMKDPIELVIDGKYLKAKDTSLGADDGIAVAMTLALLDSTDIPHPPIEAMFTIDEETGMGGANAIDLSVLKGHKLINIDSEEEGFLTVGCAGAVRVAVKHPVKREHKTGNVLTLTIKGLRGGHSGQEIHQQRGNANKMMGRLLHNISKEVEMNLVSVEGGTFDNVITMKNVTSILVKEGDVEAVSKIVESTKETILDELLGDEPNITITCENEGCKEADVITKEGTDNVIKYIICAIDGAVAFARKIEGLVETSVNMGKITTEENVVTVSHMIRSSVDSEKWELRDRFVALAELVGATTELLENYPAWQYRDDSPLREVMVEKYKEMFGEDTKVIGIHAGLECGLFLGKRPDLDCVSIGPNLWDVHSINERLEISSVGRTYDYVKEVLAALK
ncbi:MAG: aminoacyl-histidine dipeptidase [Lachnospiraceae bacterium]|nr:aminoacyl-histidine dipeptidase [Lachnospiraceae bacterium]